MSVRSKNIVRAKFPKVYEYNHPKSGIYYLVDARKKKWGLNERKTFLAKSLALKHAADIDENLPKFVVPKDFPKEKVVLADRFEGLTIQLAHFGKSPEDAVSHYIQHLGDEISKQAKPFIRDLVDLWEKFKKTDTTLSRKFLVDIRSYARFIKRTWGEFKPDEPKKNQIDQLLRGLKISNNTRKAYLRYIRMFFSWVKDEGHITQNPTDGIKFKPDDFNGEFYTPEQTADLFRHVVEHHKDLIGFYTVLTFAGLRPSEGARVQWGDFNFVTKQLRVRKGKTNARHITLQPLAMEWINYHRDNTPNDQPFVQLNPPKSALQCPQILQQSVQQNFKKLLVSFDPKIVCLPQLTLPLVDFVCSIPKVHFHITMPHRRRLHCGVFDPGQLRLHLRRLFNQ